MKFHTITLLFLATIFLTSFAHAQAIQVSNVNVDPNPVIPGQSFIIYATISSVSSSNAQDVIVNLDLRGNSSLTTHPFSLPSDDSSLRNIGSLSSYQSAQVQYRVLVDTEALDGSYPVSISAGESGQSAGKLEFTIQVTNRKPVISIISATPTQALVGHTHELELVIRNIGSSSAHDLTLGVSEDRTVTSTGGVVERDIIPLGAAFTYIPELSAGSTTTVTLSLLVSPATASKASFVPIDIQFYDSNRTLHSQTDYVGLKVSAEPQLGLNVSDYNPSPVPGKASKVTIDIYNTGLGAAKFLSVHIEAPWMDLAKKDFFLGTIESDDFDSVVLDGKVDSAISSGSQDAVLTLTFQNAFGDVQVLEKTVPVRIFSPTEVAAQNGEGFPLMYIVIIVLIIAGVWYFRFRKPKNGNGKTK